MNNRLRDKGIYVFIVTKTKKDDIIKINGYDIIHKKREWGKGKGGGVMIGIRKGIAWERIREKNIGAGK